jgi:hypothetical protein
VYLFLIEHIHQANHLQLREMVVDGVRKLWLLVNKLKFNLQIDAEAVPCDVSEGLALNNASLGVDIIDGRSRNGRYEGCKQQLRAVANEVQFQLLQIGKQYLETFMEARLESCFLKLFKMYPVHDRVISLAAFMLRKQVSSRWPALIYYLRSYSSKKFEEVIEEKMKDIHKSNTRSHPTHPATQDAVDTEEASADVPVVADTSIIPKKEVPVVQVLFGKEGSFDVSSQKDLQDILYDNNLRCEEGFPRITVLFLKLLRKFKLRTKLDECAFPSVGLWATQDMVISLNLEYFQGTSATLRNKLIGTLDDVSQFVYVWTVLLIGRVKVNSIGFISVDIKVDKVMGNMFSLVSCLLHAVSGTSSTIAGQDVFNTKEKLRVDVARFFTTGLPSFLYCDHLAYLIGAAARMSDIVLLAIDLKLLSESSFCKLIAPLCRSSTSTSYDSCFGFHDMKQVAEVYSLQLIGRYIQRNKLLEEGLLETKLGIKAGSDNVTISDEMFKELIMSSSLRVSAEMKNLIIMLCGRVVSCCSK